MSDEMVGLGIISSGVVLPGRAEAVRSTDSHRATVDASSPEVKAWIVEAIAAEQIVFDGPEPDWYRPLAADQTIGLKYIGTNPWLQRGTLRLRHGDCWRASCGTAPERKGIGAWYQQGVVDLVDEPPAWMSPYLPTHRLHQDAKLAMAGINPGQVFRDRAATPKTASVPPKAAPQRPGTTQVWPSGSMPMIYHPPVSPQRRS